MTADVSGREIGRRMVNALRGYVARSITPLVYRVKALEEELKIVHKGDPGATAVRAEKGDPGKDGKDGKDGSDGEPGRDGLAIDILPAIEDGRRYPRGTYARHAGGLWRSIGETQGMRGWECIVAGVADLTIELPEERRMVLTITLSGGEKVVKEVPLAHPIDRGVYAPEVKYLKGDGVTWAGSWWIAQVDEPIDKPGVSDQWRLAVKRGRDGKDVK